MSVIQIFGIVNPFSMDATAERNCRLWMRQHRLMSDSFLERRCALCTILFFFLSCPSIIWLGWCVFGLCWSVECKSLWIPLNHLYEKCYRVKLLAKIVLLLLAIGCYMMLPLQLFHISISRSILVLLYCRSGRLFENRPHEHSPYYIIHVWAAFFSLYFEFGQLYAVLCWTATSYSNELSIAGQLWIVGCANRKGLCEYRVECESVSMVGQNTKKGWRAQCGTERVWNICFVLRIFDERQWRQHWPSMQQ